MKTEQIQETTPTAVTPCHAVGEINRVASEKRIPASQTKCSNQHTKRTLSTMLPALAIALVWVGLAAADAPQGRGRGEKGGQEHTAGPTLTGEKAVAVLKEAGTYDSLKAALVAAQYQITQEEQTAEEAYRADNPARAMHTAFTREGIRMVPHSTGQEGGKVGLRLTGYGYGDDLQTVPEADLVVRQNRIEYRRGPLTEWYVNDPHGLEQGFTLESPPPCAGKDPQDQRLVLSMAISGDLEPALSGDGKSVLFKNAAGQCVVRYSDLYAVDSRGRELPAQMCVQSGRLGLLVDDSAALYPIVIDPLAGVETKLTASDGAAGDAFGFSVAISGDTVVVGAIFHNAGAFFSGAAYVFVRSGTTWIQQTKLTASDAAPFALFGGSVAISGDTAVVGAPGNSIISPGAAYVFARSGTT